MNENNDKVQPLKKDDIIPIQPLRINDKMPIDFIDKDGCKECKVYYE
jgi:hypothetical protein